MHWEKLKNKRTRIQIRKARSRGCCGNLQQAPSLALRLSGVGAAACQAQLPLPPRLPPQLSADHMDAEEEQGHGQAPLLRQVGPAGLDSHYQL